MPAQYLLDVIEHIDCFLIKHTPIYIDEAWQIRTNEIVHPACKLIQSMCRK